MFIEFTKQIVGKAELGEFVAEKEPRPYKETTDIDNYGWQYRIDHDYHLPELQKSLTEELETTLKQKGFDTYRCSEDKLWISGPDQFLVRLRTNALEPTKHAAAWNKVEIVEDDQTITTMTKPLKRRFLTLNANVYTYTPKVTIDGRICYALTGKIDPIPVMQMLQSLGYTTELTSIPMELLNSKNSWK